MSEPKELPLATIATDQAEQQGELQKAEQMVPVPLTTTSAFNGRHSKEISEADDQLSKPQHDTDLGPTAKIEDPKLLLKVVGSEDAALQWSFVRKIYGIVSLQFLVISVVTWLASGINIMLFRPCYEFVR